MSIPKAVKKTLLSTFKDPSDPKLLEKCLHGQTRNVNESLNGLIWQKHSQKLVNIKASIRNWSIFCCFTI